MNGLKRRLSRHLKTAEYKHWHVDLLLTAGKITDIQLKITSIKDKECETAQFLYDLPFLRPLPEFGASDCKCFSHAFFTNEKPFISIYSADVIKDVHKIFEYLESVYIDHAGIEHDPFRTLITCILSLRTKDNVTDKAAERLFSALPSPEKLSACSTEKIAKLIFPVGMYKQKAERIKTISRIILDKYSGKVPVEIDELLTLPGVGRKTANLVRSFAYHLPAICVDTHVHRITNRWGLVRTATPEHTEIALRKLLPDRYWQKINAFLVQHGQQICFPLRPDCKICALQKYCKYCELIKENEILKSIHGALTHPSLTFREPLPAGVSRKKKTTSPFEKILRP